MTKLACGVAVLTSALHVLSQPPLAGQYVEQAPPRFEIAWPPGLGDPAARVATRRALPHANSLLPEAPDYRWEGIVAGAVALGLATAVLAHGWCDSDGQGASCALRAVGGGLIGAVVGGGVGGLIGGLLPKKSR